MCFDFLINTEYEHIYFKLQLGTGAITRIRKTSNFNFIENIQHLKIKFQYRGAYKRTADQSGFFVARPVFPQKLLKNAKSSNALFRTARRFISISSQGS